MRLWLPLPFPSTSHRMQPFGCSGFIWIRWFHQIWRCPKCEQLIICSVRSDGILSRTAAHPLSPVLGGGSRQELIYQVCEAVQGSLLGQAGSPISWFIQNSSAWHCCQQGKAPSCREEEQLGCLFCTIIYFSFILLPIAGCSQLAASTERL